MSSQDKKNKKSKVQISLLGQTFAVRSKHKAAYVHGLSNLVSRCFEEVSHQSPQLSTHQLSLLVALNLAEELTALKKQNKELLLQLKNKSDKKQEGKKPNISNLTKAATKEKQQETINNIHCEDSDLMQNQMNFFNSTALNNENKPHIKKKTAPLKKEAARKQHPVYTQISAKWE